MINYNGPSGERYWKREEVDASGRVKRFRLGNGAGLRLEHALYVAQFTRDHLGGRYAGLIVLTVHFGF